MQNIYFYFENKLNFRTENEVNAYGLDLFLNMKSYLHRPSHINSNSALFLEKKCHARFHMPNINKP